MRYSFLDSAALLTRQDAAYAAAMSGPLGQGPDDWQPATSKPGELYTIEGQFRARWAFWRGLKNDHPRAGRWRRELRRGGTGWFIAAAVFFAVAIAATIVF